MKKESALYIVATPIGNLSDISYRALQVLRDVDLIAAEDTRHSAKLLQYHNIVTPSVSYHDHGTALQTERLVERLRLGQDIALIADAGTPLISDPGYRLVRLVRQQGINIVPVPGACALITALCASGLPSDRFVFEGFPPARRSGRIAVFHSLEKEERTIIFYESPHRILDSLQDMLTVFGGARRLVLARELTKAFETFIDGTIDRVIARVREDEDQRRGEFVLLLAGYDSAQAEDVPSDESRHVMTVLLEELPLKQAAALAAKITGEKKNRLYQWALSTQK